MDTIDNNDVGSLSVRQLLLLREIGRSESWTEAADVLGLAQPTVSAAVKRLESLADVPLFEAAGNRRVPTAAGQHLIDLADRVLPDIERTWHDVRHRERTGVLAVGAIDAVPLYLARDRVQRFVTDHPDVDLRLTVAGSGRLVEMLELRMLDVVVVVGPETDHPSEPVATEALRLYGRRGDDSRCVLYPAGSRTRRLIDDGLARAGIAPEVIAEASDPAVLRELAALGVGWTVLPTNVAEAPGATPPQPVGPVVCERPVVVVRRHVDTDPLVDAFTAAIRTRLPASR